MDTEKSPFINDEEEDALWKEFKKNSSAALRDKIIRKYMPLVKYVAGKVSVGLPASMEFDDLVGFGQFGLLDAISKYDLDKKVKFKTYAVTRIRGAIFDEMRQLDWVPRSVRQKSREIEDVISGLESRLSRPATDEEIAKEILERVAVFNGLRLSADDHLYIYYSVAAFFRSRCQIDGLVGHGRRVRNGHQPGFRTGRFAVERLLAGHLLVLHSLGYRYGKCTCKSRNDCHCGKGSIKTFHCLFHIHSVL